MVSGVVSGAVSDVARPDTHTDHTSPVSGDSPDNATGGLCCSTSPKLKSQWSASDDRSDAYVTANNNESCLKDREREPVTDTNHHQPTSCRAVASRAGDVLPPTPSSQTRQHVDMSSEDTVLRPSGDGEAMQKSAPVPVPECCDGDNTAAPCCQDEVMFDENVNPFKTNAKVGFSPPGGDGVSALDNSRLPIDLDSIDDPFKCSTQLASSPPRTTPNEEGDGHMAVGQNNPPLPARDTPSPDTQANGQSTEDETSTKTTPKKAIPKSAK